MRLRRLICDFLDWAFAGLDYDGPLDDPRPAGLISEQLHTNTNTTPVTPFSGVVTGGRALNSRPPLYLVSDHDDASSRGGQSDHAQH